MSTHAQLLTVDMARMLVIFLPRSMLLVAMVTLEHHTMEHHIQEHNIPGRLTQLCLIRLEHHIREHPIHPVPIMVMRTRLDSTLLIGVEEEVEEDGVEDVAGVEGITVTVVADEVTPPCSPVTMTRALNTEHRSDCVSERQLAMVAGLSVKSQCWLV
eukprot:scpid63581/ scgid0894/ 